MNKAELVKEISNRTSMTQKDVANVIDVLPEVFKDTVAKDEKINLVGFMTISKKHIPAKSGETCLGGEKKEWTTEPKDEVSIKLSKSYKTI